MTTINNIKISSNNSAIDGLKSKKNEQKALLNNWWFGFYWYKSS